MDSKQKFQYGQNNYGFILPTVFGFILISSMFLLVQGLSCVVQVYGLKAQVNNLYQLNYAINVKRVIDNIEQDSLCSFKQPLSYTEGNQKLDIKMNCLYTAIDNEYLYEKIKSLVETEELSSEQLAVIDNYIKSAKANEKEGEVAVEYNNKTYEYKFDKKYSILELNYGEVNSVKVIAVSSDGQIVVNKNVNKS